MGLGLVAATGPAATAATAATAAASNCTTSPSLSGSLLKGWDVNNLIVDLGKSAASEFGGSASGDVAGWLLTNALNNNSSDQIKAAIATQTQQIDALQTLVTNLKTDLDQAVSALSTQLDDNNWITLSDSAAAVTGRITAYGQQLCQMTQLITYAPDGTASLTLGSTEIGELQDIRENVLADVNELSNHLLGQAGAPGLIDAYSAALWDQQKLTGDSAPSKQIWTATYVNAMHHLLDYYVGFVTQALNAYAEAIHFNSPALPADNPQLIVDVADQVVIDVNAWTARATRNLAVLPAGTAVLDVPTTVPADPTTLPTSYTWWQTNPVQVPGTPAAQYCTRASGVCLFTVWSPDASDTAVLSSTIVPNAVPLTDTPLAAIPGGTWRIPTRADYDNLVKPRGSGVDPNAGVSTWAQVEGVSMLQAVSTPGPVTATSTIPPVVVDDASAQVLTYNNPTSATPTAPTPADGQAYAGRLALVGTVSTVAPLPLASASTSVSTAKKPAGPTASPHPSALTGAPSRRTVATTGAVTGTVDQPTTYTSSASTCTTGFVQPNGANAVRLTLVGAPGGQGGPDSIGGRGAKVTVTVPVQPGSTLFPRVGGPGGDAGRSTTDSPLGPDGYTPGVGGTGGGKAGGGSDFAWSGGGGGGLSGVSASSDCQQWLAVAGGGGGGGGEMTDDIGNLSKGTGGAGGNACSTTGCSGQAGSPSTSLAGQGGTLITAGANGAGSTDAPAGAGTAGNGGVGGGSSRLSPSAGGGGGGGGYGGGGGGGFGKAPSGGGGGGGGSSYAVAGTSPTVAVAGASDTPSVTITPVLVNEYAVGTDTTKAVAGVSITSGSVLTAVDDATLRRAAWDTSTGYQQQWALDMVVNGTAASTTYRLHNLSTGRCLDAGTAAAGQQVGQSPLWLGCRPAVDPAVAAERQLPLRERPGRELRRPGAHR